MPVINSHCWFAYRLGVTVVNSGALARTIVLVLVLSTAGTAFASKPTWAKKATPFPNVCFAGEYAECKPIQIASPDQTSSVEVTYFKEDVRGGEYTLRSLLHVT